MWKFLEDEILGFIRYFIYILALMAYLFLPLLIAYWIPEGASSLDTFLEYSIAWLVFNVVLISFSACVAFVVSNDQRDISLKQKIKASLRGAFFYFIYCITTFALLFTLIATVDHVRGRPFLGGE